MAKLSFASQDSTKEILLRDYGVTLVSATGGGALEWKLFEESAVLSVLRFIPEDLAKVGKSSRTGRINLQKSFNSGFQKSSHQTSWALGFQTTIDLGSARHLRTKLGKDQLSATEQAQYTLFLQRKLIHHLLHLYDAKNGVSTSHAWRNISGWRFREYFGIELPIIKDALNQDPRNYTRDEGMLGPEEDFATFGEFYFIDQKDKPEQTVKCRIPDKFKFFELRFNDNRIRNSWKNIQCQSSGTGFLDDIKFLDPITRRPIEMGPFDPDHVSGFELLYATPGVNDAAEIAGHLILRVKLKNNPEALALGVENPNDLVISFLADTEAGKPKTAAQRSDSVPTECRRQWFDFGQAAQKDHDAIQSVLQALKGLSGGFLTVYDRQTLYQAMKTYTVDQDRNLLRYELILSEAQKASLIRRLYVAKKNFKSKYYFFDRNCASILVQLIGEGIGDREIAEFDPFVVPPNSLVALLIRKGLAKQTFPSFYSYRKKGYIAQGELRDLLKDNEPLRKKITSKDAKERLTGWKVLFENLKVGEGTAATFYQLASLGQDAELSFLDRNQLCENVTPEVTTFLREAQRDLLKTYGMDLGRSSFDTNVLINQKFQGEEALDARTGSQNTQLSSVAAGALWEHGKNGYYLSYAVHRQDAGSVASQAMQRGTSVRLGDFYFASFPGDESNESFRWRATGLEIRKFKEKLYDVPSYFSQYGKLGLGLSLLKLSKDAREDYVRSTVAGGGLLFNLVSSRLYLDYLYLGVGADVDVVWSQSRTLKFVPERTFLAAPLTLQGLLTLGESRLWQFRFDAVQRWRVLAGDISTERKLQTKLQYRIPERLEQEFLLSSEIQFERLFREGQNEESSRTTYSFGLEWNRW